MGFSGGGGGALPAHEHTNIANDGGPLDFVNTTVAGLSSGSLAFSNGAALQELSIGGTNQALTVSGGGAPNWTTLTTAASVLTTAGDILTMNAVPELARLGIATDGDVMTLASGLPSWVTQPGGGKMVFLETFTATASDVLTCTLSTPIPLADFVELIFIFNGEWATTGTGQLEMQVATNNYLINGVRYHSQETVLTTASSFKQTVAATNWQVGTLNTASGSKGTIYMSLTVPNIVGGHGDTPNDIYIKWWQISRSQFQVRGSGFTYDNVGQILTLDGIVLTNSGGDNMHTSSTVDVYKVTR